MTMSTAPARLIVGDRPRLEIPLTAGPLPAWLSVALPGPLAEERPEGRFVLDPRLPESALVLAWGEAPAYPRPLRVLTVTLGEESWVLEQDVHHPGRWLRQAGLEARRHWS
jgi:hypothetical protein